MCTDVIRPDRAAVSSSGHLVVYAAENAATLGHAPVEMRLGASHVPILCGIAHGSYCVPEIPPMSK